jgi:hypothetical protein
MARVKDFRDFTSFNRLAMLLIVIGAIFGADTFWHLSLAYRLWPLIITILGTGFLGIFIKRDRHETAYLAVGVYLIGFSGLALYCCFTSWSLLSFLWPLFIAFLGIVFLFIFLFCKKTRTNLLLGLLLVSLSAVFYFVFSVNAHLWWTVFILAGLSILVAELARE